MQTELGPATLEWNYISSFLIISSCRSPSVEEITVFESFYVEMLFRKRLSFTSSLTSKKKKKSPFFVFHVSCIWCRDNLCISIFICYRQVSVTLTGSKPQSSRWGTLEIVDAHVRRQSLNLRIPCIIYSCVK